MEAIADFVYPEPCLGCRRLVRGGICRDCLRELPRLPPPYCGLCGGPAGAPVAQCRQCRGRGFRFDRARQVFAFGSIARRAIHELKYRSHRSMALSLALVLAEVATEWADPASGAPLRLGAVTWVPSSTRRLRDRGFDHARLLAEALAGKLGAPCAGLVVKARETEPQVGLEPRVRRDNLHGAFACRLPPPPEILVVDDVFTTGATASEAARALKAGGAKDVTVLALARTLPPGSRSRSLAAGAATRPGRDRPSARRAGPL